MISRGLANTTDVELYPEYIGHRVIHWGIVWLVLATLFVALRFISRRIGKVPWYWDDACVVVSSVFLLALIIACFCDTVYGGVGYHEARLVAEDPGKITTWKKFLFIIPLTYFPAVAFAQVSLLMLYLRLFGGKQNMNCRIIILGTISMTALNMAVNFFVAFGMCKPLASLWGTGIQDGKCIDINSWLRWGSLPNIFVDAVLLFLPAPAIITIHAPIKVKIGLAITFLIGSSGLITAIVRFRAFFVSNFDVDGTFSSTTMLVDTMAEPGLYLIAACMVALRPVMKWTVDHITGKSRIQNDPYIVQTRSFTVSKADRFHELNDERSSNRNLVTQQQ